MAFFNLALLKQSWRITFANLLKLGLLFVGFDLLFEGLSYLCLGTEAAQLTLFQQPQATSIVSSHTIMGMLLYIAFQLLLAPMELVLLLAMLRSIRSKEPVRLQSLLPFLRERYAASFRGFFQGFGRFMIITLGVVSAALLLFCLTPESPTMTGIVTLLIVLAPVPILLFLLPYIFATYYCILRAPLPFRQALSMSYDGLRGRRTELILTLLVCSAPILVLCSFPLMQGGASNLLISALLALLTIPPSVATYLFFEDFERHCTTPPAQTPLPLA